LVGDAACGRFSDADFHTSTSHTCAGFVPSKMDFEGFFGHPMAHRGRRWRRACFCVNP
jgi:hypothetical protein